MRTLWAPQRNHPNKLSPSLCIMIKSQVHLMFIYAEGDSRMKGGLGWVHTRTCPSYGGELPVASQGEPVKLAPFVPALPAI